MSALANKFRSIAVLEMVLRCDESRAIQLAGRDGWPRGRSLTKDLVIKSLRTTSIFILPPAAMARPADKRMEIKSGLKMPAVATATIKLRERRGYGRMSLNNLSASLMGGRR